MLFRLFFGLNKGFYFADIFCKLGKLIGENIMIRESVTFLIALII
jgi:hypothetical protein